MKDSDLNEKITARQLGAAFRKAVKVFFIPFVLLLPLIFAFSLMFIAPIASQLGIFYMRPELPVHITLLLFPLTWIYLVRRTSPGKGKMFARNTAVILLLLLSVSTTMETVSVAPMVKIDRGFVAEGWVKNEVEISPGRGLFRCFGMWVTPACPKVQSEWMKVTDKSSSLEDLQKIAIANRFDDFAFTGNCGDKVPSSGYPHATCKLSGKSNGVYVTLNYHDSNNLYLTLTDTEPKY